MYFNGENCPNVISNEKLEGNRICESEKIWTQGAGLPHPGALNMYITCTIKFKDLLL